MSRVIIFTYGNAPSYAQKAQYPFTTKASPALVLNPSRGNSKIKFGCFSSVRLRRWRVFGVVLAVSETGHSGGLVGTVPGRETDARPGTAMRHVLDTAEDVCVADLWRISAGSGVSNCSPVRVSLQRAAHSVSCRRPFRNYLHVHAVFLPKAHPWAQVREFTLHHTRIPDRYNPQLMAIRLSGWWHYLTPSLDPYIMYSRIPH